MTLTQPETLPPELANLRLPDHTQLPETDGTFVQNFQEHPQSIVLTESLWPVLQQRHPDGQFCVGQDSGIYWHLEAANSETPVRGAVSPDWFYVPGVPPMLNGQVRRSYVLWKELIPPFIVVEFVSGDGSEERNRTPVTGKFWIYEQFIRPAFYGIYEVRHARIELYHLVENRYELVDANSQGRYSVGPLGIEFGIWRGSLYGMELPWMRCWDAAGNLLLTGAERAEQASQRAEQANRRAERLAEQLRALGIEPDEAGAP